MKTIVILGGGLKKNPDGSWGLEARAGNHLRVHAGALLWFRNMDWKIIASGGNGQIGAEDGPPISSLIKEQLTSSWEVPPGFVSEENQSRTTFEQLQIFSRMRERGEIGEIVIISNDWHLPRIAAMIKHVPELENLSMDVELISAEAILDVENDPVWWSPRIEEIRNSDDYKELVAKEQWGVEQIKNGTYGFGR